MTKEPKESFLTQAPGDERVGDIRRWRKRLDNKGSTWSHERVGTEFATALEAVDYLLSLFAAAPTPTEKFPLSYVGIHAGKADGIAAAQAPRVDADALADNLHNQWSEIVKCHGVHNGLYDVFCKALSYIRAPSPSPTPAQIDAAATRVWEIMSRKGPVEPGTDHERIVRVLTALVTTPAPTKAEVSIGLAHWLHDRYSHAGRAWEDRTPVEHRIWFDHAHDVLALLRTRGASGEPPTNDRLDAIRARGAKP